MSFWSRLMGNEKSSDYTLPAISSSETISYQCNDTVFNQFPTGSNPNNNQYTLEELANLYGMTNKSSSGKVVTPENAFRVSAVYACIDRIAGAIKSLPFIEKTKIDNVINEVPGDYHFMFNMRACAEMTASDAWQFVIMSKLLRGDGYAELLRPNYRSNKIIGWRPIHPDRCFPFYDENQVKRYLVTRPNGQQETLNMADVLQFTSLGYDGLTSPSPITYAGRDAIGTAIAAQDWMGEFFQEGAKFDFALSTEKRMTEKQVKELTELLKLRLASNGRAPLLLSNGLQPAQITINPKDAQILESRQFTLLDIFRLFGVPPHLVGHTEKSTTWGSGLEELGAAFVRYTLNPHLEQAEQEASYKIHGQNALRRFFKFDTHELTRGDIKTRYEAYRMAVGRSGEPGWLTPEEIRVKENEAPEPTHGSLTKVTTDNDSSPGE